MTSTPTGTNSTDTSSTGTSSNTEAPAAPTLAADGTAPWVAVPPRTLSILSLVAAIASIPLGHFIILPIAAIILGFYARKREPWARTFANWGIGLGFAILFWWVAAACIAAAVWLPFALLHTSLSF